MELDVFAGGEVAAASRVFVRNVREDAKLRGLQNARGDLHAQHLESWLPLAVRAVLQAKGAELFGRDGAFCNCCARSSKRTISASMASRLCRSSTSVKAVTAVALIIPGPQFSVLK